jgi:CRISPR/Cas system-associated exonuclease Cas4 (RecB family)
MPVSLPPAFRFSASSLQDFADCARRFQLRYLWEQDWPAPAAEPLAEAEHAAELGRLFHLTMERHWRGLPIALESLDPALRAWWAAFESQPPPLPDLADGQTRLWPERSVSAVVAGQRLTATFDLLLYDAAANHATIVDWKTSKPTRRGILERRLQTVIYPLMLVAAAPGLFGRALRPEEVRMVYWFTTGESEVFAYTQARHDADLRQLEAAFARLFSIEVDVWPLTAEARHCRLCQYRSLCDRGRVAGAYDEGVDDDWPDVDELRGVILQAAEMDEYVL